MTNKSRNYNSCNNICQISVSDAENNDNLTNFIPPTRRRAWLRLRWTPTSKDELETAERKLLSCTTITSSEEIPPLVFIHGVGAGLGFFVSLIQSLQYPGTIYAIDLPGFGRSTKFKSSKDPKMVEETILNILEEWRKSVSIPKMFLVGLSFGGFLSTAYAIKYPERVAHLFLIDPWGAVQPPDSIRDVKSLLYSRNSFIIRLYALVMKRINVFTPIRLLGPWGPEAVIDPDCNARQIGDNGFIPIFNEYMYHCISLNNPSGETMFRSMMNWIVFAKYPLCHRFHLLSPDNPVTMFYPEDDSFLPNIPENEIKLLLDPKIQLRVEVENVTIDAIMQCNPLWGQKLGLTFELKSFESYIYWGKKLSIRSFTITGGQTDNIKYIMDCTHNIVENPQCRYWFRTLHNL